MKRKIPTSKKVITAIVIVVIVAIGLLMSSGRQRISDAVISATLSEMNQVGKQMEILLEDIIDEGHESLTLLARYTASSDVTSETYLDFISTQSQAEQFAVLYYIDLEGNGISKTGNTFNFYGSDTYINTLANGFYITEPHVSLETNEVVFGISVSIIKNNQTSAILYGEVSMANFFEVMESGTAGTGDLFIVDNDLNLVFSTSENHAGYSLIPESDMEELGIENVLQAQSDILSEQSGGFYYDYFGVPKVMIYHPLSATGWTLAMNVEVNAMNSTLVSAVDYFELIYIVAYWTIVVLVMYISFSQYRANKTLTQAAYFDSLTQLANKEQLRRDMRDALERPSADKYSIIVFDIENFKAINEMFSHDIGDRVLKSIKSFNDTLNEPSLITPRIGDDKFVMFAKNRFLEDITALMQQISTHIDTMVPELVDYAGTLKVGRYRIAAGETDVDEIINKVALAHTRAKTTKSELLCDYDDAFRQKLLQEAEITNKMRSALENNEFKVFLQPKFSTSEAEIVGAEALVRWIEPDGTMIMPGDFIPLFERNGFIVELDNYIFENVCILIRRWLDDGVGGITISVNHSRLNLENPFFIDILVAIANKHNVPHEYLEIELTESTTIANEATIEQLFIDLRSNGFKTSIDDFGAGYSSLGMLKNLHADTLKMDRSFFVGGTNVRRDDLLIDSIVKMSHNLGMQVVAEGIETTEQVELLKTMNCDAIQGFVHARPMPINDFEEKYVDCMLKIMGKDKSALSLIPNLNDAKYASTFAPCGILIAELDEFFTVAEANQSYFNMLGCTREEFRDTFQNRGMNVVHPDDRPEVMQYFIGQMQKDPTALLSYSCRLCTKHGTSFMAQLSGQVSSDASGRPRLYFSAMDISHYAETSGALQEEKEFNAFVFSQIPTVFFGYDVNTGGIRFSQNLAMRFNLPEVIPDFAQSDIGQEMFPDFISALHSAVPGEKTEGDISLTSPGNHKVWYHYNFDCIHYEALNKHVIIGSMSEVSLPEK